MKTKPVVHKDGLVGGVEKSEPLVSFHGNTATLVFNPPEECRSCHTARSFFIVRIRKGGPLGLNCDPLCVECDEESKKKETP